MLLELFCLNDWMNEQRNDQTHKDPKNKEMKTTKTNLIHVWGLTKTVAQILHHISVPADFQGSLHLGTLLYPHTQWLPSGELLKIDKQKEIEESPNVEGVTYLFKTFRICVLCSSKDVLHITMFVKHLTSSQIIKSCYVNFVLLLSFYASRVSK